MYPEHLTTPMEQDLTDNGFTALKNEQAVIELLDKKEGTVLLVINSVCGCAAGNARPGVKMAVKNTKVPTHLATVFAGVDRGAVNKAREYMLPYPPSSPSIALFKEGRLVHFLERHHIEGNTADVISDNLKLAFNAHCS